MDTVRAFIAVDIGARIRRALGKAQRTLQRAHADVKWVRTENIHLTLAFLGQLPVEKIPPLEAALASAFHGLERFGMEVAGVGAFGKPLRPQVLWAGILDCPSLGLLQVKTLEALHAVEVGYDAKPFAPHLTLGRVKSIKHMAGLLDELEKERNACFGSTEIGEVLLIRSKTKPDGAEYAVLHRFSLQ